MKIWQQVKNIVEKRRNCSKGAISPLFHNIFNISLTSRVQLHIYLLNVVNRISSPTPPNSANLICRSTDISKYFRESLGIRDNESRLYIYIYRVFLAQDFENALNKKQPLKEMATPAGLLDLPPILQGRQVLGLPVCFHVHKALLIRDHTLNGKILLPRGANSFNLEETTFQKDGQNNFDKIYLPWECSHFS